MFCKYLDFHSKFRGDPKITITMIIMFLLVPHDFWHVFDHPLPCLDQLFRFRPEKDVKLRISQVHLLEYLHDGDLDGGKFSKIDNCRFEIILGEVPLGVGQVHIEAVHDMLVVLLAC